MPEAHRASCDLHPGQSSLMQPSFGPCHSLSLEDSVSSIFMSQSSNYGFSLMLSLALPRSLCTVFLPFPWCLLNCVSSHALPSTGLLQCTPDTVLDNFYTSSPVLPKSLQPGLLV